MVRIAMLGCGLIGDFYAQALLGQRSRDQIQIAYSRSQERLDQFQRKWNIKNGTTDMLKAIEHPQVDAVVIATPNHLHEQAAIAAANAGKAILCTKP
ncbi:MAG: Gfo/Idh/MocA family oxidoreductase, partial [Planctomycetes bacterium]|nr:Gfo/Idh/MocA family oxidoreductase [Planctomycetota bacterium]